MISSWRGVRTAVVGLGKSNMALIRYLLTKGAVVTGCDQKTPEQLGCRYEELVASGIDLRSGDDYLDRLDNFDAVMLTPGMVKDQPPIVKARQAGVYVGSEIGLFLSGCRGKIVGITGSSGKSTTTTLTGAMLAGQGRVFVGGNIGRPLIELVDDIQAEDYVVLELSSFQLELVDRSPHVSAVLNVAPNHLDVHRSFADYIEAKTNIIRFQTEGDEAVLNWDCPVTRNMGTSTEGQVHWFGSRCAGSIAHLEGDEIVLRRNGRTQLLCLLSELPLYGRHNAYNVMAAASLASLCGMTRDRIVEAIQSFSPLPHRLEVVAERDGVIYVNDSIATAPDRSAAALQAFDRPIILIAGGYDKKLSFDDLGREIVRRAKAVILVGSTADAIEQAIASAGGELPVMRASDITAAVKAAQGFAAAGDLVLLSPACASYDMFANFEDRGKAFCEAVKQIAGR